MSGLNSLSGLNKVNVDFRPTVELTAPKKTARLRSSPSYYKRDYLDRMFN